MGTPDFAVASLAALLNAGFDIVGVVTAADKPAGRGQKLNESAVKKFAIAHNLKVLQPLKLKAPDFIEELRDLGADLQVVVAFRMLPEVVWAMPPKGTINLHGSLLPDYRGAAPINHAIINGESESGVTTFFLTHEIDTGDIIKSATVSIGPDETAGELHDKLMETGAALLVETVKSIEAGNYSEQPQQSTDETKHAPKLFKEFGAINWTESAQKIHNLIRGLSPYPTAYTHLQDKTLKIFKAELETTQPEVPAGTYITDGKTYLKYAAADGILNLLDVQLEGKKRMPVGDLLRGMRF